MGAGVSAGESNDDLVNNLMEADYIKTSAVERIFRAVDRGEYFLPYPPVNAYRDVAWKNGNFHISAPCIYSEVMEGLKLKPGLSFLNLGSGTGYLSTMVGLVLGHNGINHGVELHADVVQYAYKKLEEFKQNSGAVDEFDFCEPKFIQGNCLCLDSGHLYDRVYCGAACPEQYLNYMKNFIKIGGILIVPLNDQLLEMKRLGDTNWNVRSLLPVSFANLILPQENSSEVVRLYSIVEDDEETLRANYTVEFLKTLTPPEAPAHKLILKQVEIEPLSLQESCRATIRNLLRKSVESEFPVAKTPTKQQKILRKKRSLRRDGNVRRPRTASSSIPIPQTLRGTEELFNYFLLSVARRRQRNLDSSNDEWGEYLSSTQNSSADEQNTNNETPQQKEVRAVIEHEPSDDDDEDDNVMAEVEKLERVHGALVDILTQLNPEPGSSTGTNPETSQGEASNAPNGSTEPETSEDNRKMAVDAAEKIDEDVESNGSECSNSTTPKKKKFNNREKLDSGLGDEIMSAPINSGDTVEEAITSSDEEQDSRSYKRSFRHKLEKRANSKWRRIESNRDADSSDYEYDSAKPSGCQMKMYRSLYSAHMENKIKELPLPSILKKYLHYYREL